jgi:hypothetical protein
MPKGRVSPFLPVPYYGFSAIVTEGEDISGHTNGLVRGVNRGQCLKGGIGTTFVTLER